MSVATGSQKSSIEPSWTRCDVVTQSSPCWGEPAHDGRAILTGQIRGVERSREVAGVHA